MKEGIIGLCGYAQVGKDTAAQALVEQGWGRVAFADELKIEVKELLSTLGFYPNFDCQEDKKFWRDMLVFWGRKRRVMNKDYWVEAVAGSELFVGNTVVTDVRYLNEVKWIQEQGGVVVWIHRPGYYPANEEEDMSFSAIRQNATDIINLGNDGTIKELHNKMKAVIMKT